MAMKEYNINNFLSSAGGLDFEIMSWGYTLVLINTFTSCSSSNNCSYYEQPLPYKILNLV